MTRPWITLVAVSVSLAVAASVALNVALYGDVSVGTLITSAVIGAGVAWGATLRGRDPARPRRLGALLVAVGAGILLASLVVWLVRG